MSSFAPQTATSFPGARQAYLQSNRADGSQAVFGKPSQVLSGRGRCSVGVHHFGLDLVSMLSSAISQLQHPAGSCMTKAAAAAVLALEALMPQRAAANQHAGIPGVYLRQATPLSRPACAVRVALQRVSHKCLNFTEATSVARAGAGSGGTTAQPGRGMQGGRGRGQSSGRSFVARQADRAAVAAQDAAATKNADDARREESRRATESSRKEELRAQEREAAQQSQRIAATVAAVAVPTATASAVADAATVVSAAGGGNDGEAPSGAPPLFLLPAMVMWEMPRDPRSDLHLAGWR